MELLRCTGADSLDKSNLFEFFSCAFFLDFIRRVLAVTSNSSFSNVFFSSKDGTRCQAVSNCRKGFLALKNLSLLPRFSRVSQLPLSLPWRRNQMIEQTSSADLQRLRTVCNHFFSKERVVYAKSFFFLTTSFCAQAAAQSGAPRRLRANSNSE